MLPLNILKLLLDSVKNHDEKWERIIYSPQPFSSAHWMLKPIFLLFFVTRGINYTREEKKCNCII